MSREWYIYLKFFLWFRRWTHKETFYASIENSVVRMSLIPDEQQRILLPGRIWTSSDVMYKISHSLTYSAYALFITSHGHILEGLVEFLLLQYSFLKAMLRQFPSYLAEVLAVPQVRWAMGRMVVKGTDLLYHNPLRCLFGQFIPMKWLSAQTLGS